MSKNQLKELTQRLTALAEKLKWHNVNHAQDVALSSESITSLIERLEVADKDGREYAILAGTNADRAEKAERERDEYAEAERSTAVKNVTLQDEIYGLKAELARRDAAAGEPVSWQYRYNDGKVGDWHTVDSESECNHHPFYERRPIYSAAPPAVLPPEIDDIWDAIHMPCMATSNLDERECCVARDAYNQCRADALALGAQQQKVVELPDHKFRECVNSLLEEAIAYAGTQQLRARLSSRLSNFVKPQRVENVKWEVKK